MAAENSFTTYLVDVRGVFTLTDLSLHGCEVPFLNAY